MVHGTETGGGTFVTCGQRRVMCSNYCANIDMWSLLIIHQSFNINSAYLKHLISHSYFTIITITFISCILRFRLQIAVYIDSLVMISIEWSEKTQKMHWMSEKIMMS